MIVGGVHDVPGATMLEKRNHLWREGDRLFADGLIAALLACF